jgi:hypothetical protein
LLAEGQIEPIIMRKFPLLEAAAANKLLESGQVVGNVVLAAPELLEEKDVVRHTSHVRHPSCVRGDRRMTHDA